MRQSTRLIVNATSLFGRMALTIGISLLVTRLLLQAIGKIDFGLILALGATGAMLEFVTGALTDGVQRQLSREIAHRDFAQIRRVFSTAWLTFAGLGITLWLVGQTLAPLILHGLTIPADRANAAWWVYQIALLNLVLAATATPYQAMVVAHQHLTVQATAEVLVVLARLAAVLLLAVVPWDHMVAYVAMQLIGYAVVRLSLNAYCLWRYEGSMPRLRNFDRSQFKQIVGIGGWNLLGQLSWRFRMQGGILLLNVFFGPAVNAAYGISAQVAGYVLNFAQAVRLTVLPAIVGAFAKGNQQSTHRLALVAGKYTVLLLSLLFVPLWLEADYMLRLWLPEVPPFTVILTRLVVIWALAHVFSIGYNLALMATGDIGWYTRYTLLISVLVLVVAGIGFYFGLPPWFLPAVTLVGTVMLVMRAVYSIGACIELPPARWYREAFLPALGALLPAIVAASLVHGRLPAGLWRFVAVTGAYGVIAAPLIWRVGLADWERHQFLRFAASALTRLRRPT